VKREVAIFGAGEWGRMAYYYYSRSCEIVCYLDNDKSIWDKSLNNIPICTPDILKEKKYAVIIANKQFEDAIKQQLLEDYGIEGAVVFRIEEEAQELYVKNTNFQPEGELIVAFSHGLGNQMFQYALYRVFASQGKKVRADLSAYIKPDMRPFELENVFPNITLEYYNPQEKEIYLRDGGNKRYIETAPRGDIPQMYKNSLLEMESGYVEGFHCSYKYSEMVRTELLKDFEFSYSKNKELVELKAFLEEKKAVGIHIRRGDVLEPKYVREIGGICGYEYYRKAIDLIKKKYSDLYFCFFSNDMEWVKKTFQEENALYMEEGMFRDYHDWYDLYLMSICKHNIIPNSTFGWWGAWLNKNPNKTVIAPKRWRNRWDAGDWCPPDWVLI